MSMHGLVSRISVLFLIVFPLNAAGAAKNETPTDGKSVIEIDAFFGSWRGTALAESEDSVYFALTQRDVGLAVKPVKEPEGAFGITWFTVQRKKGDPVNPTEERKETRVTFVPGKRANLWWEKPLGDPAKGETMRWARIEGNTLVINTVTMRKDGSLESQTYRRTLTEKGMALSYSRVLDGKEVRSVSGQLVKMGQ